MSERFGSCLIVLNDSRNDKSLSLRSTQTILLTKLLRIVKWLPLIVMTTNSWSS